MNLTRLTGAAAAPPARVNLSNMSNMSKVTCRSSPGAILISSGDCLLQVIDRHAAKKRKKEWTSQSCQNKKCTLLKLGYLNDDKHFGLKWKPLICFRLPQPQGNELSRQAVNLVSRLVNWENKTRVEPGRIGSNIRNPSYWPDWDI